MTVSELLVRCLEAEGVTHIFGVPGEENEDLLFALDGSGIRFVPCRHEQGAAFIANVWGRLSGKPGVCLSTLGPGATNLITGLADAQLDKAPVVAITAQGGLDRLHHQSHQLLDIVQMFKPIVKWNASVHSPAIVADVVRKAFRIATMEKPGVTHIELPEDVAGVELAEGAVPLAITAEPEYGADPKAVERTVGLLRKAKRPLLLAGNGAIRDRASRALTALVQRTGIPVAATFMGKGAIADSRSESLLAIGLGFRDYVMEAMDQADLVIAVGYDIAEYAPQFWNPDADKTVIHVDTVAAEIYPHYIPAAELIGDVSSNIDTLTQALPGARCDDSWYAPVRQRILADIASYTLQDGDAFTIPGTLNIIRHSLPDAGLLISDVGSHKLWVARNFPTGCACGCIISNGLASMGIALPGGIAAALHDPGRAVVSLMGDGGFLMNVQELETAKRLGVGYTLVVVTDNDYGLISWKQEQHHGRSVGTRIDNPDFAKLADSFGLKAYTPGTVDELRTQIAEAIESRALCLVVVPIDAAPNMDLVNKLRNHWREST